MVITRSWTPINANETTISGRYSARDSTYSSSKELQTSNHRKRLTYLLLKSNLEH